MVTTCMCTFFDLRFLHTPSKKAEEGVRLGLNLRHSILGSVVFCLGSIKKSVQTWHCASFAPKQINIQESEHNESHTYAHSNGDHFAPSTTEKSIINPHFSCVGICQVFRQQLKKILQCQQTLFKK